MPELQGLVDTVAALVGVIAFYWGLRCWRLVVRGE